MYIINALKEYSGKREYFTTPGHSHGEVIPLNLKKLIGHKAFEADFSEVVGLDNLQNPGGIIEESQKWASEIYGSRASFYLVNGSSSGIIALMMTVVKEGEKVLIARNAHKSVINALTLSGACPVWINTEWIEEWNIPGEIKAEKIQEKLDQNPDIKAVFVTNPTYEGVVSDIKAISEVCKKKNVALIVDEAHGALWNFSYKLPQTAIQCGADASIQSLHKTTTALTQSAILHLGRDSKISPDNMQRNLNIINTTSPSYLLLASIEGAIQYLNSKKGKLRLENLIDDINKLKNYLLKYENIRFLDKSNDMTKIFVSINCLNGCDLADILYEKYRIEVETENNIGILALTGIGTTSRKLEKLANALEKIARKADKTCTNGQRILSFPYPITVYTPREILNLPSKKVKLEDAESLISAETIVKYPPGIPILIPGERITRNHIELLNDIKEVYIALL